jgi:hypothetical protein
MAAMKSLLSKLHALEVELHHPGVICSRTRLEELSHPEFHEVGRSGVAYSRDTVIQHLAELKLRPAVISDSFTASKLGPAFALLVYRSAIVDTGNRLTNHTLRSSLWVKTLVGWQLRYHQGTPAAELW